VPNTRGGYRQEVAFYTQWLKQLIEKRFEELLREHEQKNTDVHGVSSPYYIAKTSREDQLPSWIDLPDKPFSTLGAEFTVSNGELQIASISRSKISDFWSTPFWDNIPDKPSQYPPEPHASSHAHGGTDELDLSGYLGNDLSWDATNRKINVNVDGVSIIHNATDNWIEIGSTIPKAITVQGTLTINKSVPDLRLSGTEANAKTLVLRENAGVFEFYSETDGAVWAKISEVGIDNSDKLDGYHIDEILGLVMALA